MSVKTPQPSCALRETNMKKITILFAIIAMTGCTTFKQTTRQAKTDWVNFRKTIEFNSKMPVVYSNYYF